MNIKDYIFFDHNATTPLRAGVWEAMSEVVQAPLNPSSIHGVGREAKKILTAARNSIAKAFGAEGASIVFTSCGTESNNMALRCVKGVDVIVTTEIEHPSISKPASYMNNILVAVDENGLVRLDKLSEVCAALKEAGRKFVVSVIHANNETGVIQDTNAIAQVVFANSGFFHIDASQSAGKIPFDFNSCGADMATISAHKMGGPKGAAALIIKKGLDVQSIQQGGSQENFLRAGTENLASIIGFAKAAELAVENMEKESIQIAMVRDFIETEIKNISPDSVIFCQGVNRLPNTCMVSLPGMGSETQLINFDLEKVAISAGSACTSGRVVTSHVLVAMGVKPDIAQCAIRISLGADSTLNQAKKFLSIYEKNFAKTKQKLAA